MGRNRKLKMTSGPSTKGQVKFYPLSGDSNPAKGVILQGPDSVGVADLSLTLPPSVVNHGVVKSDASGVLSNSLLVDNNVDAAAAIAHSKMAALTANKALASDASGVVVPATTTDTELNYVSGVTSAIQTQLNTKQPKTLTDSHILVGNGSNLATDVPVTGDIALSNTGATSYVGVQPIATGGTGQITANAALNALLPSQGGKAGKVLGTNGTNTSWVNSTGRNDPQFGPPCTSTSGVITAGSFTTYDNSPTLTFTPTVTGTYKVYTSIPTEYIGNGTGTSRIAATAGSPTLLAEMQSVNGYGGSNSTDNIISSPVESWFTLTSGTSYSFDIQALNTGGVEILNRGDAASFSIFAEQIG